MGEYAYAANESILNNKFLETHEKLLFEYVNTSLFTNLYKRVSSVLWADSFAAYAYSLEFIIVFALKNSK